VELHHRPLAEPDVNLSAHPAPIKQTCRSADSPVDEESLALHGEPLQNWLAWFSPTLELFLFRREVPTRND
jgi:hypothetical protein